VEPRRGTAAIEGAAMAGGSARFRKKGGDCRPMELPDEGG